MEHFRIRVLRYVRFAMCMCFHVLKPEVINERSLCERSERFIRLPNVNGFSKLPRNTSRIDRRHYRCRYGCERVCVAAGGTDGTEGVQRNEVCGSSQMNID